MVLQNLPRITRVLLLSCWLGVTIWYNFLQAPILFANFPTLAGEIIEVLFPWYWLFGYLSLGITAFLYFVAALVKLSFWDFSKAAILLTAPCLLAINQLWVMPNSNYSLDKLKIAISTESNSTQEACVNNQPEKLENEFRIQELRPAISRVRNEYLFWQGTLQILNFLAFLITLFMAGNELLFIPRQPRFH